MGVLVTELSVWRFFSFIRATSVLCSSVSLMDGQQVKTVGHIGRLHRHTGSYRAQSL